MPSGMKFSLKQQKIRKNGVRRKCPRILAQAFPEFFRYFNYLLDKGLSIYFINRPGHLITCSRNWKRRSFCRPCCACLSRRFIPPFYNFFFTYILPATICWIRRASSGVTFPSPSTSARNCCTLDSFPLSARYIRIFNASSGVILPS